MDDSAHDHADGQPPKGRIYDLEERSAVFGETVIRSCRDVPIDAVTMRIISQLVGAAGSVGANYCEGDDAVSRKRVSTEDRVLQEGSKRSQALAPDDGGSACALSRYGSNPVEGSG
jgi:hypothetical protein